MLITLEQLQEHPVKFDERFAPGHIDYLTEGLRQVEVLEMQGRANLLGDEIEVRGGLATKVELTCARCLEPFTHAVDVRYNLVYRPLSSVTRGDEFQVPHGEEELGFYRESGLLLEEVAKEQLLLSLPIKTICQAECRGLCPVCGANLNREQCGCAARPADPRWEGLLK
jgi:uncharacterized protein